MFTVLAQLINIVVPGFSPAFPQVLVNSGWFVKFDKKVHYEMLMSGLRGGDFSILFASERIRARKPIMLYVVQQKRP